MCIRDRCDAEALVEKQLSRYAAAPGQLTQDRAAALMQSITVYPPQDGTRRIEPVSYTHLDVYKRQVTETRQRSRTLKIEQN